jgi:hypothetical protein
LVRIRPSVSRRWTRLADAKKAVEGQMAAAQDEDEFRGRVVERQYRQRRGLRTRGSERLAWESRIPGSANSDAERLCRGFGAGSLYRDVSSSAVAERWSCSHGPTGTACGFDGHAQCEFARKPPYRTRTLRLIRSARSRAAIALHAGRHVQVSTTKATNSCVGLLPRSNRIHWAGGVQSSLQAVTFEPIEEALMRRTSHIILCGLAGKFTF